MGNETEEPAIDALCAEIARRDRVLRRVLLAEQDENEQLKEIQRQTIAASDANAVANARLRALIKAAEWSGPIVDGDATCPWCKQERYHVHASHFDQCPAFTPEGEVR